MWISQLAIAIKIEQAPRNKESLQFPVEEDWYWQSNY